MLTKCVDVPYYSILLSSFASGLGLHTLGTRIVGNILQMELAILSLLTLYLQLPIGNDNWLIHSNNLTKQRSANQIIDQIAK